MIYLPIADPVFLCYLLEQTEIQELGVIEQIIEFSAREIDVTNVIINNKFVIYSNYTEGDNMFGGYLLISNRKCDILMARSEKVTEIVVDLKLENAVYQDAMKLYCGFSRKYGGYPEIIDKIKSGVFRVVE